MKYLTILILLLWGCEFDVEYEFSVDPRLHNYVDSFYQEADARGVSLHRNLIVRIESVDAAGRAFSEGEQRIILISPDTYDFFTSGKWVKGDSAYHGLENLMYHELGHAMLNRKHCDPCYSLMASGMSMFEYAGDEELRKKMVDELFNYTK